MGYTTEFDGEFFVTPTLQPEHAAYLREFSQTRRMKRNPNIVSQMSDPIREAVSLPIGIEGEYFVGTGDNNPARLGDVRLGLGQVRDQSVVDYNHPPNTQPGLWCQWMPSEDGTCILWSGMEKFYHYTEWIQYWINHFLQRWGYSIDGEVEFQGEDVTDRGVIVARNNHITLGTPLTRPDTLRMN